ncbi:hypothetical protein R1flu_008766 [Riccia fluitans]|uniref:Secreted protein n=1 Tax=Riccia fluitans TaxID=41844 RepID=A0ABD1XEJ8_9MARC
MWAATHACCYSSPVPFHRFLSSLLCPSDSAAAPQPADPGNVIPCSLGVVLRRGPHISRLTNFSLNFPQSATLIRITCSAGGSGISGPVLRIQPLGNLQR